MQFPRLVFKSPGAYPCVGGTYSYLRVESEAEFTAATSNGWYESIPDALGDKPMVIDEPVDNSPPTRAELEQKATELGIKIDGRWSDRRLLAEINLELKNGE